MLAHISQIVLATQLQLGSFELRTASTASLPEKDKRCGIPFTWFVSIQADMIAQMSRKGIDLFRVVIYGLCWTWLDTVFFDVPSFLMYFGT